MAGARMRVNLWVECRRGYPGYKSKAKVKKMLTDLGISVGTVYKSDEVVHTPKGLIAPYKITLKRRPTK